jgi:tetratricopeptide (TPR) repeat protein
MPRATAAMIILMTAIAIASGQGVRVKGQRLQDGRQVSIDPAVQDNSPAGSPQRAREFLKLAEQSLQETRYRRARIQTDKAAANAITRELRRKVLDLYEQLERVGRKQLVQAENLETAGSSRKAIREYRAIIARFGKLPCADKARTAFIRMRKDTRRDDYDPEKRAAIMLTDANEILAAQRAKRSESRSKLPSDPNDANAPDANAAAGISRVDVIRRLEGKKLLAVIDAMEAVVNRYPATDTGGAALEDLLTLRDDETFAAGLEKLRRRQAIEELYQAGKALEKAGARKAAIRKYRQLIRTYPDSPYAKVLRDRYGGSENREKD